MWVHSFQTIYDTDRISQAHKPSTELPPDQPELDSEEVRLIVRELHPFGQYQHPECEYLKAEHLSLC